MFEELHTGMVRCDAWQPLTVEGRPVVRVSVIGLSACDDPRTLWRCCRLCCCTLVWVLTRSSYHNESTHNYKAAFELAFAGALAGDVDLSFANSRWRLARHHQRGDGEICALPVAFPLQSRTQTCSRKEEALRSVSVVKPEGILKVRVS